MTVSDKIIRTLESRLDDLDGQTRKESLEALNELAANGSIAVEPEYEVANLHCHSFFSYNGYGFSPSHLAWLAKKNGYKYIGVVDFDVLDGVDEFLDACNYLGIRGTAGMETRVFIPEFSEVEINSPGEPGVCYHMGVGFTSSTAPPTARRVLEDIRLRVAQRNCRILEKINQFLDPLIIDFERDILPMTPSGNATERHIVTKITEKAAADTENPVMFWSEKLGITIKAVEKEITDPEGFQNTVRKKLMKRGGVGYIQPTMDTFPLIDEFYQVVFACQAIPCAAWLDGTSPGEQSIERLLDVLISKGTAAINIIPERNWNIADAVMKETKLKNLYHIVQVAIDRDLPILAGTEMNSYGQKMADDFDVPELLPIKQAFIDGADFLYGHTRMQRNWGMGYQSGWAEKYFDERKTKNEFFKKAGKLLLPAGDSSMYTESVSVCMTPDEALNQLTANEEI